jgi:hypothetical protein
MRLRLALPAVLALLAAGPATASVPSGNLLADPGAEDGAAAPDAQHSVVPPGWFAPPAGTALPTAVTYGAPGGFPSLAQAAALDGGRAFFAGGPPNPDPKLDNKFSQLEQTVDIPAAAFPDVDAGNVVLTMTACLGGYASQDDTAEILADVFNQQGQAAPPHSVIVVIGPNAAARGNATGLVPVNGSVSLTGGIRRIQATLLFVRSSGAGTYNDAYADNIGVYLTEVGTPTPTAHCSAPPAGAGSTPGPGGGAQGGAVGNPAGSVPALARPVVAKGGSAARLSSSMATVAVPLTCEGHDASCAGSVQLTVAGLPHVSSLTLGSRAFSIPPGATRTVQVRLGRSAKRRLARLSDRQRRRLRVTATVTIGGTSSSFGLRLKG